MCHFWAAKPPHPILPWLFTSPAACRRDMRLLTSANNAFMPLAMRTGCFYHYLSLSSQCLGRQQIYLSHTDPQTSPTKQVSELSKTWGFEILACHNSPHRWNVGLLEVMSFAITFNTWQLSFWENHCLAVVSRQPSVLCMQWYPAWPDPSLFLVWLLTKMKVLASLCQIYPDSTCTA